MGINNKILGRSMLFLQIQLSLLFILMTWHFSSSTMINRREIGKSCSDIFPRYELSCICSEEKNNETAINCDGVTFSGNFPMLPHRSNIVSFTQSGSGLQSLEAQLFTASAIPLQKVDFSNNLLRRITERTFDGVEDTLLDINFSNNKLGDQLNLLFSTGEFQNLHQLKKLDISGNEIKEFQSGVFNGLQNLEEMDESVPVKGEMYAEMIQKHIFPSLADKQLLGSKIFMQDSSQTHIARCVKDLLRVLFGDDYVLSRHSPNAWPPRSLDLMPCDYWLWGYLIS